VSARAVDCRKVLSDGSVWRKRNCDEPFLPTQRGGQCGGEPDDGGERAHLTFALSDARQSCR